MFKTTYYLNFEKSRFLKKRFNEFEEIVICCTDIKILLLVLFFRSFLSEKNIIKKKIINIIIRPVT